jgi:hypothetical protein
MSFKIIGGDESLQEELSSLTQPTEEKEVEQPTQEPQEPQVEQQEEAPQEAQPEVTPEPTPEPEIDYSNYISPEVFEEKLKERLSKSDPLEGVSDRIRKMIEFEKAGGQIDETFLKYQTRDFNAVDTKQVDQSISVLKEAFSLGNPGMDEESLNHVFKMKYPALFNKDLDMDDAEDLEMYNNQKMSARIDADQALRKLKAYQEQVLLPPQNQPTGPSEEEVKRYITEAENHLKDFGGVSINFGKDADFTFEATPENTKDSTQTIMNAGENFFQRYITNDGVDFEKMNLDMFVINNWEDMAKAIWDLSAQTREKEVISESLTNQNLDPHRSETPGSKSDREKMIESINSGLKRRKFDNL